MEHKHIAEEVHFFTKRIVLKFVQMSSIQRVNIERTKLAEDCYGWPKALILHTSYADGNHFDEEDKLYELADEYLSDFYEENGIEQLYDIDDVEY